MLVNQNELETQNGSLAPLAILVHLILWMIDS